MIIKTVPSNVTDHGGLAGLSDDDHSIYALLLGRSGGQVLIGGTASGDDLTLNSTSNATKGSIFIGASSEYDDVSHLLGIGLTPTFTYDGVREGSNNIMQLTTYHTVTSGVGINFRRSRGTVASATALIDGDTVGILRAIAHRGSGTFTTIGNINYIVEGIDGSNNYGCRIILKTAGSDGTVLPRFVTRNTGQTRIMGGSDDAVTLAMLDVEQDDTAGALPVLKLDQADISEEMIEFATTIGTGNAIEAIAAKSLTTTHFIKITIPGALTRYIPCGTIA